MATPILIVGRAVSGKTTAVASAFSNYCAAHTNQKCLCVGGADIKIANLNKCSTLTSDFLTVTKDFISIKGLYSKYPCLTYVPFLRQMVQLLMKLADAFSSVSVVPKPECFRYDFQTKGMVPCTLKLDEIANFQRDVIDLCKSSSELDDQNADARAAAIGTGASPSYKKKTPAQLVASSCQSMLNELLINARKVSTSDDQYQYIGPNGTLVFKNRPFFGNSADWQVAFEEAYRELLPKFDRIYIDSIEHIYPPAREQLISGGSDLGPIYSINSMGAYCPDDGIVLATSRLPLEDSEHVIGLLQGGVFVIDHEIVYFVWPYQRSHSFLLFGPGALLKLLAWIMKSDSTSKFSVGSISDLTIFDTSTLDMLKVFKECIPNTGMTAVDERIRTALLQSRVLAYTNMALVARTNMQRTYGSGDKVGYAGPTTI